MEIAILIGLGVIGLLIVKKRKNKGAPTPAAPGKPSFYCKECGKEFASITDLNLSMPGCLGPNNKTGKHALYSGVTAPPFYCKHCGKEFPSLQALCYGPKNCKTHNDRHEVYEGNPKPPFYCKHCGKEFPSLQALCYGPNNCESGHKHEVFEGK